MSAPSSCCNPCDPKTIVEVPGVEGEPGVDGINAFTNTAQNFDLPAAAGDSATFIVANNQWVAVGQNLFVSDGTHMGTFVVTSLGDFSIDGNWLQYSGDSAPGTTILTGAKVTPAGNQPSVPIAITDGGTGATGANTAQENLGLGQPIKQQNSSALAYTITNSYASVGITITATVTARYQVGGFVAVKYTGTTFASSQTLSIRARNVTSGVTLSETTALTDTPTTTGYPTLHYVLPEVSVDIGVGETVELQIQLSTVPSAGTAVVSAGSLHATPLAYLF